MCNEVQNEAFLVKIADSNVMPMHVAWIPLVSVFCGSGVISGIRGKQILPKLLNEAFLAKITII